MQSLLSITIPTYNRPEKLCQRLVELLPQLDGNDGIEILVVDNASTVPSEEVIRSHFGGILPQGVNVLRNVVNIGLAANICRCFEHSSGTWTWILGDDDTVFPNALEHVLKAISCDLNNQASVGLYCFSSGIDQNESKSTIASIDELFKGLENQLKFSNFLFISSKVFLTKGFRDRARLAYHYCYTLAPHLAVSLSLLESGFTIQYERELIVGWRKPEQDQKWSCILVAAGLPTLAEIDGAAKSVRRHLASGLELMLWKPFLRGGINYILFDDQRGTDYWFLIFLRIFPFLRGGRRASACLLIVFGGIVVSLPLLRPLLRILLSGFRIRMIDEELTNDRN
jgi:glycosyltransferase involved in cell wall biosynthesis